ncbi:hypothetical protein C7212DRAFT_347341 [Tuber magnatum]|uniref:Uncharacterized protein n=1 Tax=Tuber magnatum TaxID=42249 RepID=A0A317SEA4_9PEZI|nr:hypothetical protein C7212DRAFT_347341 [Tuber magnatum]
MSKRVLGIRRRTATSIMQARRGIYEAEDKVGDSNPVTLSGGNINIVSYGEEDAPGSRDDRHHHWGRDRYTGNDGNEVDSDKDDADDMDGNVNVSEDDMDHEVDENDDEGEEDDDEQDEENYQDTGERMDQDRAGAEPGYYDSYQNYCGNGSHQGNNIRTYQNGIDISQHSGVFGVDIAMGLSDMWYSVDIPGGQSMPRGL